MLLYRAVVIDNYDFDFTDTPDFKIHYQEHLVIRETFKFYVVRINCKERRIGKYSKRQFAVTTKEKALMDAWHRNATHKGILRAKLEQAERVGKFIKDQIDA